jgi:hypothetical protein
LEGLNEGRIVHYVAYNGRNLAAMVIGGKFTADEVNLAVFSDMLNVRGGVNWGLTFQADVPYSEEPLPGTWHWIFPGQATYRQDRQK